MGHSEKTPDTATRNRQHAKGQRTQWVALGLTLLLLAIMVVYQIYEDHRTLTIGEKNRLQTQARVIASNMERQLGASNQALKNVIDDLDYLRSNESLKMLNRRLTVFNDVMPGVRTMLLFDAKGVVTSASRSELIGKDFSSRDYYKVPQQRQDGSFLYVSPPFKSVLGPTILNLSRIVPGPDKRFDGVVVAALDPEYFDVLLESVRYAPDMTCAITHADGQRFMMVPENKELIGKNQTVPGSFFLRHTASTKRENIFTGRSVSTGEENMMAVHTVSSVALNLNKPLYVFVSRKSDDIYAGWRGSSIKQILVLSLVSVAAIGGMVLHQRRQRALELQAQQAEELIQLRLVLMEYSHTHNMHSLLQKTLDEVCRISASPIGFYHFVEDDQQGLSLQAWSTRTLKEFCTASGHDLHYRIEDAGVWADCVREKRPIMHNDYNALPGKKGLPDGHAAVIRELVVPILRAEKVVAILGVGNKSDDYTERDIELVTYLADVAWEIVDQKRAEEAQLKAAIRYQTLQNIASDGIHIIDMDGNLVESNASFRTMLGYPDGAELKLNVRDWDMSMASAKFPESLKAVIQKPATFETRHRRYDGSIIDVEVSACGVKLDDQWYLYASSRDISKRKELESSLLASRQQLSDIFDFLPDATFVVDLEQRVLAWNKAMERMSGVPKEEIVGLGDHAYTIPFYGERRAQLLDLIDVTDEELEAKYKNVIRKDSILYAEAFCPALYNGKGAYVWAIVGPLYDVTGKRIGAIESIRDITEIKQTETNLARSNQELEQFAYVASHDLQEPLRKIAGFTELLGNRCKDTLDEKSESYMAYIVDGATRMRSLINDLLSYSRVMRSTKELVDTDCSAIVLKVMQDMELSLKESNAEVVCEELPVLQADKTQLSQLFQNLIGNGLKYHGATSPKIVIKAVRQANDWLFTVSDNGIGIAPEFFERIFVIFQRLHTRAEYPGTGIGLAVCQKIVERHGGRIWVESVVGSGSTFFFTIPATSHTMEV